MTVQNRLLNSSPNDGVQIPFFPSTKINCYYSVPAAFRWLSKKYPKIISRVIEDSPKEINGVTVPIDITQPNPNNIEYDNLYLDFNGIVHPCSHPEDKPPPANEEEMMLEIYKYTERVINMVRPRKLLFIAIDGVAPRAKMNQQRSRRFRSAQDSNIKAAATERIIEELRSQGKMIDDSLLPKRDWDSNAITPGTEFMEILALSMRYESPLLSASKYGVSIW